MKKPQPRKRGTIEPRGDRKWLVKVYLGEIAGVRKYSSKTIEGTFKMAEQHMTRMQRDLDTDSFVAPSKLRVSEFIDQWLAGKGEIGPKTRMEYEDRLRLDVTPFIGLLALSQVSRQAIKTMYGKLTTERGLQPSTIKHTHRILHQAFEQAVEDGLIARNPCTGAQKAIPAVEKTEADFLTPDATMVLLKATADSPWFPLWCLMVNTGLRPQEALALKWTDLDGDTLRVQRALVQISRAGKWEPRNDMKADASRRNVLLDQSVLDALKAHRKTQAVEMLKSGVRGEGFIFSNQAGGFLDISKARKLWKQACVDAKLPAIKFYEGTRHTHASHLLGGGVDVKTVAARLGHANPTMLLTTYAHVIPSNAQAAASILSKLTKEA